MRLLTASLLVAFSVSAQAKEAINIGQISGCLVLPGAAVDNHASRL
ncbi:hypothetical protein [Mesorhizobium sp. Mes31]|nr:hypothetical protein [Mesorhizobium sp. Mes31]